MRSLLVILALALGFSFVSGCSKCSEQKAAEMEQQPATEAPPADMGSGAVTAPEGEELPPSEEMPPMEEEPAAAEGQTGGQ